jgi:hypothetical protein
MALKGDDEELEIGEVIQQVGAIYWERIKFVIKQYRMQVKKPDVGYHQQERFQSGMLTIGCVGQPNGIRHTFSYFRTTNISVFYSCV